MKNHDNPRGLVEAPLTDYLRTELASDTAALMPELLPGGHSNISYRLDGGNLGPLVLRRPPLGHLLPTAHDMGREFKLLTGLASVGYPVPQPIALCEDAGVIGAPFVLMEFVDGLIIDDAAIASSLDAVSAREASQNLVRCLADLHNIDPVDAGLADLGKPAGYLQRQLLRWIKQWELTKKIDYPAAGQLITWLQQAVTTVPENTKASIVHGDFRLDNTILDTSYLNFCLALSCFKLAAILESIKHRSQAGEQLGRAEHSGDLFGDSCNNLMLMGLAVTEGDGVSGLNR